MDRFFDRRRLQRLSDSFHYNRCEHCKLFFFFGSRIKMPLHLIHESTSSSTAAASQNGRESVEKRPSRPNDNIYKQTLDLCLSLVFNCEKNKINKLHSWLLIQFQVQQKEEKISSLQFENEKKTEGRRRRRIDC